MKVDRTCEICKKDFIARSDMLSKGRGKYCSVECQHESYRNGVVLVCEYCEKDFYVNQSALKEKPCRFCSKDCHHEWKKDNSSLFSGENSPTWNGGKTKQNAVVRASSDYKTWRTAVFERDNYTCTWCGDKNGDGKAVVLHADHIKPFAYFPKLRFEVSNGRTLCTICHRYTASYMGRSRRYYGNRKKTFTPMKDRIEYGGMIIGAEEHDAIFQSIMSQGGKRWTVGEESIGFEKELAEKVGMRRAIVTNSGSSALLVALTALHLPKGSKVIVPALNFPTAFNSILQCGLIPYVVDIDIKTLNLDLNEVKKAVNNEKIEAVVAVNIASNPVDYVKLREIVGSAKIICDNCDGAGTLVNGKYVDTLADISCMSFHAAHIIGLGEGGACLTDNLELADRIKKLREWGRADGTDDIYEYPGFPNDYRSRYVYEEIGFNMKPLELQCAMGRVQLKKLEDFREARLKNAKKMREIFEKYPQFQLIDSPENAEVCWFSFPLLCTGIPRKKVMDTLEANNIECRTIFSGNILRHPAYKDTVYISHGEMVNADIVMRDGMFLSVHPSITDEMLDFIDEVLKDLCK